MKHPHYLCLLYGNNCHHKGTPLKTPRPLFSLTPLKWLFILPVVSLQGWTLGRSSVHATLPTPTPITTLISLLISPGQHLTETAKKGSLLYWGLPHIPQEWRYHSKYFSTGNLFYTPWSILCHGGSFDSVKWFSINIYYEEEKESFFP